MTDGDDRGSIPQRNYLARPMGYTGIILFGFYFVVFTLVCLYLLFGIWPSSFAWERLRIPGLPFTVPLDGELRLLLISVLAGALGSFVHAATSFATYLGNRNLIRSWAFWYLLRPFIGMTLALILYLVVRGGFLAPQANAGMISPYGVGAVSALAGMFSKQVADKLKEVFENLFPSEQDEIREDKLGE